MNTVDLAIRMTADATDATKAAGDAGDAYTRMAGDIDSATRKADAAGSRLDSVADASDNMASSSSQAAGGLGDLGGALALMPGPLAGVGAAMETVAPAIMGVTGAADLLNLATSSTIVTQGKARVAAILSATAHGIGAAATAVMTGAQAALNAVMAANPIALVVLAIVALVAIIVIAYKRSETFRRIVDAAFRGVQKAAQFAWNWIKGHWPLLLAIITGPIGLAVLVVVRHWDTIKAAASRVFDAIKVVVKAAGDKFGDFVAGVKGAREKVHTALAAIRGVFERVFTAVLNFIQPVLDAIQGLLDKVEDLKDSFDIDVPDWLGGRVAATGTPTTTAGAFTAASITVQVQGSVIGTTPEDLAGNMLTLVNRGRRAVGQAPL